MRARSEAIELEDLLVFLPEEQAGDALEVFDCDADGRISADDLREAVLQIYENRWGVLVGYPPMPQRCRPELPASTAACHLHASWLPKNPQPA